MIYVDVAFRRRTPLANNGVFTYSVPSNLEQHLAEGVIVTAPLQKDITAGIVVKIYEETPPFEVLPIEQVIQGEPVITPAQLLLAKAIATGCFTTFGKALTLFVPNKIWLGTSAPPKTEWLSMNKKDETSVRGKKMQAVLDYLQSCTEATTEQVKDVSGAGNPTLKKLIEQKMICSELKPQFSNRQEEPVNVEPLPLNDHQSDVIEYIERSKAEKPFLLFGAAGAGKSHTIRALSQDVICHGKTVAIIVPEIGLTGELLSRCKTAFGEENVAVFHSQLSEGERIKTYWRVFFGDVRVVVGSRLALFLPFQDLGLVAVEEEHEWTFKEQSTPRYHACTAAKQLGQIHGAKVIFSSATPTLETWTAAKEQKLNRIDLPDRTEKPQIEIADMREEIAGKNYSPISRPLQRTILETIAAKKQVLLFLNRRGVYRVLTCEDCGEAVKNPENEVPLVVHGGPKRDFLLCHHTGKVFQIPSRCPVCGGTKLKAFGSGTAGLERTAKQIFQDARIVRIDRDTTAHKNAFYNLHETFDTGNADILIGTQIVSKGLDFQNIGLVGIIAADAGLHIPDFRANERTYQLITQVMGRGGRGGNGHKVILQTRVPNHPVIQAISKQNTSDFYDRELQHREQFQLPPYRRIIKLIFSGKQKEAVYKNARKTEELLKRYAKQFFANENAMVTVAPALVPRKHEKYFVNVLLFAENPEPLIKATPLPRCIVDVDPIDIIG
jgi:primosomal protein N' (replication factor Y)